MEPHREEEGVRSQSKLRSVKLPLWVTLLLLLMLVGAVGYIASSQGAAERRHEGAMQELTTRSDAERAAALSAAQAAFTRHTEEAYRLFGQHFPASLLEHTTVALEAGEAQMKRLVLPIQGLNERLGPVMLVYEAPPAGTS